MRSTSNCFPCFMEQAHSSVCYALDDESKRWEVLREASVLLSELRAEDSPAYNSSLLLHRINELMGVSDPYASAKQQSNKDGLALVPRVIAKIKAASDKLEAAVRLSVVGNVMDLGIKHEADLDETMEAALGDGYGVFEYGQFKDRLAKSKRLLYILDNAGEIALDKVLIEGLKAQGKMVVAAVRGGAIINDATMEDARAVGLDKVVKVIDTGSNFVGVVRDKCSETFLKVLDSADMVIAKGQGNYETLDDAGDRFFFVLKAKCPHVARTLGIDLNRMALVAGK